MHKVIRGMIAGLAGTAAMSATMVADLAFGWMRGELPPRKVGRRFLEAVGLDDDLSWPEFEASWVTQHVAYGAAAGVAYELMQEKLRLREPVPSGPLFGAAVWAGSYAGWLPVSGLYPPPTRDRTERIAMMIVHHLVYGTTVSAVARALRTIEESGRTTPPGSGEGDGGAGAQAPERAGAR